MTRAIVVAAVLLGATARAQEASPPAPKAEAEAEAGYADRAAADLYEQAIRADAVGKHLMAQQLATEALTVSPDGRYAPEVRRFLSRGASELLVDQPPQENYAGPRAAYVLSAGLVGATAGFFASWGLILQSQGDTESFNGGAIAGFMVAGAILGVAASAASMGGVTDGSRSLHLWAGATYGAWIAASAVLLAQSASFGAAGAGVGAGIAVGALVDTILAATAKLTPGGGAASVTLGNIASLAALGFEAPYVGGSALAISLLVFSTLGFVGGELLNSTLHWSSSRWGLTFLSAILGIAIGGALAAATNGSAAGAILASGGLVGFGIGAAATTGMRPEAEEAAPPPAAWSSSDRARPAMFSLAF